MMNDIYLEYILKKKKTGGQKAIIAVIIFAAIIVSLISKAPSKDVCDLFEESKKPID